MTEEAKKHLNFYKFASFPFGPICLIPVCYGVSRAVQNFISDASDTIEISWWCSWAIFGGLVILAFVSSAIYSYPLPKDGKTGHRIYILISTEDSNDDKYITNDFKVNFEQHLQKAPGDLCIIVPNLIKRENFNRTIANYQKKHKIFWDSKRWAKKHKKLQGALYISGTLKRRSSGGKENFVFDLSSTISYNDVNKRITPLMKEELSKFFPPQILINKEFELEGFKAFSNHFATYCEYSIGWAHLVSGNIGFAYTMHADIYTNHKQSFSNSKEFKYLPELLHIETDIILRDCKKYPKDFILNCISKAEDLFYNSDTLIMIARARLMLCNDDSDFNSTVLEAQKLINMVQINDINRSTVYANKAYISLLRCEYSEAEKYYETFFNSQNKKVIDNILDYCSEQIENCCSKERPTVYFVKALMFFHSDCDKEEKKKSIKQALRKIPEENEYYHRKLNEMESALTNPKKKRRYK